jgi:hypothetical protein
VRFRNGTERETSGDGAAVTVRFANGDVKRTEGGVEAYWYADAGTLHTSYAAAAGAEAYDVYEFAATGQVERHVGGATVEVWAPEGAGGGGALFQ